MEYDNQQGNSEKGLLSLEALSFFGFLIVFTGISIHATYPLWRDSAYKKTAQIREYFSPDEDKNYSPRLVRDQESQIQRRHEDMQDYHAVHPIRE